MDDRRPGDGSTWAGGSFEGAEPGGAAQRREGGSSGDRPPASSFPTFGRTPGWQDEPDPYGLSGYDDVPRHRTAFETGPGYPPPYDYGQSRPPATAQGASDAYGAYDGAAAGYGRGPAETEGNAVAALVLSIAAWFTCPITAIVALVFASSSKAKIRAFPDRYTGLGLVRAATVISWLNIGLLVAVIFIAIVVGAVSASALDLVFGR